MAGVQPSPAARQAPAARRSASSSAFACVHLMTSVPPGSRKPTSPNGSSGTARAGVASSRRSVRCNAASRTGAGAPAPRSCRASTPEMVKNWLPRGLKARGARAAGRVDRRRRPRTLGSARLKRRHPRSEGLESRGLGFGTPHQPGCRVGGAADERGGGGASHQKRARTRAQPRVSPHARRPVRRLRVLRRQSALAQSFVPNPVDRLQDVMQDRLAAG